AETIETDSFGQAGLEHDLHRLRADGGKENLDAVAPQLFDRPLERVQTARIHRRHTPHSEDDNARLAAGATQRGVEFFGGGKEHRTLDAIENYVGRNVFPADAVRSRARVFAFLGNKAHVSYLFHLAEKKNDGHDQAGADADREI